MRGHSQRSCGRRRGIEYPEVWKISGVWGGWKQVSMQGLVTLGFCFSREGKGFKCGSVSSHGWAEAAVMSSLLYFKKVNQASGARGKGGA